MQLVIELELRLCANTGRFLGFAMVWKCSLKAHVKKAWSPACCIIWEVVEPLGQGASWEEIWVLRVCP
jgi:hypothetical protein